AREKESVQPSLAGVDEKRARLLRCRAPAGVGGAPLLSRGRSAPPLAGPPGRPPRHFLVASLGAGGAGGVVAAQQRGLRYSHPPAITTESTASSPETSPS